jgi:hypothetical protein
MNEQIGALRKVRVLLLGGALAVLTVGAVHAAVPAADGTISACYDKQSGQVRIVDPEKNLPKGCGPKEISISWNAQGTPGQDGADGQDGQDGASGISGYIRVSGHSDTNSVYDKTAFAFCPDGTSVLGGGAGVYGPPIADGQAVVQGVGLVQNHPFNATGWTARASEFIPTDDDWYLGVWAICATV